MPKNQKNVNKFNFTWLQVQKRAICAQIELSNPEGIRLPKHVTLGKDFQYENLKIPKNRKIEVVETPGGYWKLNYYAPLNETVLVQYCSAPWAHIPF